MKAKKLYYFLLHAVFVTGIIYAFGNFITTPKIDMLERRLWAYEYWVIFSFYLLFVYLTLTEREIRLFKSGKLRIKPHFSEFKRILAVNLILLIFPWGLFLIFAPREILVMARMGSIYWRILGACSLIGALVYYFPYRFYKRKFSYYILIFGAFDNLIAGLILTLLFLSKRVPLIAWGSAPLLFYFAYFFKEQVKNYPQISRKVKNDS